MVKKCPLHIWSDCVATEQMKCTLPREATFHKEIFAFLADLSSRLAIVIRQCLSCGQQFVLKAYSFSIPGLIHEFTQYLVGSMVVTCRSKQAKIISIWSKMAAKIAILKIYFVLLLLN